MLSSIFVKIKTKHWTIIYYTVHFIGILCALALIAVSFLTSTVEQDTVGKFNLDLTENVIVTFYVAGGIILLNSIIGYFAQSLPNRPSLYILYCIIQAILTVIILAASVSAISKSKFENIPVNRMKLTMEDYESYDKNSKWDQLHKKVCADCRGLKCLLLNTSINDSDIKLTLGYQDWQDVHFGRTSLRVPISCCRKPDMINGTVDKDTNCGLNVLPYDAKANDQIFARGCLKPSVQQVATMLWTLGIMGFTYFILCFGLAVISCYLVVTKKI